MIPEKLNSLDLQMLPTDLAKEIVRRYNGYVKQQTLIEQLAGYIQNALMSLRIMKIPCGANVATNDDLLRIMENSFKEALASKDKEGKEK